MRRLRRPSRLAAGILLLVVGAVVAPTPIPVGLILMLAGLTLLVAESVVMRDIVRALRRRMPALSRGMTRARSKVPGPLARVIDLTDPGVSGTPCRCAEPTE